MKKLHEALEPKIKKAEKLPKQPSTSGFVTSEEAGVLIAGAIADLDISADSNVDGGSANSVYLVSQNIDGEGA